MHVVHWRKSYWQRQNRTLRKLGNRLRCRIRMDPSVRKHVSGSNYRCILRFHQPIPSPKKQTILANALHACVRMRGRLFREKICVHTYVLEIKAFYVNGKLYSNGAYEKEIFSCDLSVDCTPIVIFDFCCRFIYNQNECQINAGKSGAFKAEG
jgi:hypothetical protein